MQIDIDRNEQFILLDALIHPAYKDKVSLPQTKFAIRKVYWNLVAKLRNAKEIPTPRYGPIRRFLIKIIVPGKDN